MPQLARTLVVMRIVTLAFAFLLAACSGTAPVAAPEGTPSADAAAPAAEPQASVPASVQPPAPATRLEDPAVVVSGELFPIVRSLALRPEQIDEEVVGGAERALTRYLASLDRFRDNNFDPAELTLTGAFREAVIAGLRSSATPGVQRRFELEALRVDRLFEKPWGTRALAEVTVTILDRAVSGSAPDQRETGRLRLTGERSMQVTDGWDGANGRWFNGSTTPTSEDVRGGLTEPISSFLRGESWLAGSSPSPWSGGEPTPFSIAHASRIASVDRARTVSRVFEGVRAVVERYDTFDLVRTGLASVRVTGTIISTDAAGRTDHAPFERHLKVLLFAGWSPEVVDEEIAPGVWLSGGDLALQNIDVNRA